ncbi:MULTISPECIES: protein translocase SEC61 complex subunit gamma [Methanobacterium]|jgi:protein transport protein SEC61 subunit gamma-like protein|uniref:Protein translocase subunit SecE n=1 Tax=Methanobacterium subterraneum TaxID=59277 RepID=A0A2H4V9I4_9EURY|nr:MULTISPECIES: protein translocase SEC61 complex subunit gamma [Methanobacterium]MBW4256933.1 protein translocase SEC61 complex subunit gamma [Methanobacterium sp. YSL]PKL72796.1 MAG: protein translocase SEC61 complex subunit gamma [Methanobacteriales archaeon HGW-Methanobacteriales-2]AUB54743.1 protein translocase SEC61 complex subunit gamma [Methanobacterium subterraneum]AUB58278.1 protein translocase SEC61 complex subunit gamma [Methanobacterium sp. MZ-A1]AUB59257.1 protein translocase SE
MNLNKESMANFIKQCQRVLKVSKKPDREEYINVAKVTGIGIILIGVIGFIISIIGQLIQGTG